MIRVARRIAFLFAVEKRGHGDAEMGIEFTSRLRVVLGNGEHCDIAVGFSAVEAFQEGQRELASGAAHLEEREQSGFLRKRSAAAEEVFELEVRRNFAFA